MTQRQLRRLREIIDLLSNNYISPTDAYAGLINLIDEIRIDGVIDIDFKEIKD